MAYNYNEWSYSTPSQLAPNNNNNDTNESLWTASTCSIGSILRSSSRYTTSKLDLPQSCKKKKVRIVSPIKWDIDNKSDKSLALRREFINTTISYCDLKRILRNLGCDTRGCYDECVDRLLSTKWIPDRQYIEYNEKLRAKPIHDFNQRVIKLESAEIEYLQRFTINELKKWLKYNNIEQPHGATKLEYMKLINLHFLWRSPSPDSMRFKVRPNRPCHDKTKTMSRTPRTKRSQQTDLDINAINNSIICCNENDKSKLDFDEYEDDGIGTDIDDDNGDVDVSMTMEIDNNGYDEGVRMQLCFDD